MKMPADLAPLLQAFFTQRLMAQRQVSPHTLSSYRDTFRLLLKFAEKRLGCAPSNLTLEHLAAPLVAAFLDHLEATRANGPRTRNLRLAAIRSFFRYAAAPPEYTKEVSGAGKLNITFRFRSGSHRLDWRSARDLDRLIEILKNPTYQGRQLLLFGFSDSYGDPRSNLMLSRDRARSVAQQLQRRGITPALVTGFGVALPVAFNDTDEGREQNRRVEAWLR